MNSVHHMFVMLVYPASLLRRYLCTAYLHAGTFSCFVHPDTLSVGYLLRTGRNVQSVCIVWTGVGLTVRVCSRLTISKSSTGYDNLINLLGINGFVKQS